MNIQLSKVVSQVSNHFLLLWKPPEVTRLACVVSSAGVNFILVLIVAITGNYQDKRLDKWQGRKIQYTTSFCQITQWKLCQPFVQTLLTGVFTATRD